MKLMLDISQDTILRVEDDGEVTLLVYKVHHGWVPIVTMVDKRRVDKLDEQVQQLRQVVATLIDFLRDRLADVPYSLEDFSLGVYSETWRQEEEGKDVN